MCDAGWFESPNTVGSCGKCGVGSYKTTVGNSGDLCVSCGVGESTQQEGSTTQADCSEYYQGKPHWVSRDHCESGEATLYPVT